MDGVGTAMGMPIPLLPLFSLLLLPPLLPLGDRERDGRHFKLLGPRQQETAAAVSRRYSCSGVPGFKSLTFVRLKAVMKLLRGVSTLV